MYKNGTKISTPEHESGNNYTLDPGLTQKGKDMAYSRFQQLLGIYPIPTKIYVSPYLRTRETAEIAQKVILENYKTWVPIVVEVLASEYLNTKWKFAFPDGLTPETAEKNPQEPTTVQKFKSRVKKLVNKYANGSLNENVWVITHGFLVQTFCEILGARVDYPNILDGVCISDGCIECLPMKDSDIRENI